MVDRGKVAAAASVEHIINLYENHTVKDARRFVVISGCCGGGRSIALDELARRGFGAIRALAERGRPLWWPHITAEVSMLSLPAMVRATVVASLLPAFVLAPAASAESRVPTSELMAAPPLPDVPIGRADAPVTMIEYASLTCTHCAHFHETVWPVLLKDYVETGKVRFILREFPYEPLATAAFMLARCEGPERRNAVVDLLFETQRGWAFGDKPLEALEQTMRQTGMGHAGFDACLKDQALYKGVIGVHDRAEREFGVHATPTFFIGGSRVPGEIDVQTLRKMLDPAIAGKS